MVRQLGFLIFFFFCFSSFLFSQQLVEETGGGSVEIKKALERVERVPFSRFWEKVIALESRAEDVIELLEESSSLTFRQRLVLGRLYFRVGRLTSGIRVLRKLILDKSSPLSYRLAAVDLLYQNTDSPFAVRGLEDILEEPTEPALLKIAVAKVLRLLGGKASASALLKKYLRSSQFRLRSAAALALAEIGNPMPEVREELKRLALLPSSEGRQARLLLTQMKLLDKLQRSGGLSAKLRMRLLEEKVRQLRRQNQSLRQQMEMGFHTGQALLDEILDKIQKYYDYHDPKEIDKQALLDAAAKGITNHLDPHSVYFTVKETQQFRESMSHKYVGIGAYIQVSPEGYAMVARPIYGGPAYKAGLHAGDRITHIFIDGKWVSTRNKKITELLPKVRGPEGTVVRLKVWRKSWKESKVFKIVRATIKIPLVYSALLPGKIGYILLTSFGEKCEVEFERALRSLEGRGMRGLILDLRDNPGGYLISAVRIADKFIAANKLIVYSQGRNSRKAPRREFYSTRAPTHGSYPLVVLVNGGSASASEILSGALKIHHRATLIGTKTYGKGSVQEAMPLRSKNYQAILKLTIAKYYLPDGTNIDKKGIEPHIVVKPVELEHQKQLQELYESKVLDEYLDRYYSSSEGIWKELARFDGFSLRRYPHYQELWKRLKNRYTAEDIRRILRLKLRRRIANERGRDFACDFQEDRQLRYGIRYLLKKLGVSYQDFPEYRKKLGKALERK